jgi:hypothetical protein
MKSNLPLRVDQNTTLVDVKYDKTHSTYWYVIDKPDQFDAQETARQVQIGVCNNADNSSTMKKEGFSYEYHYKTKNGLALTDFKVTTCDGRKRPRSEGKKEQTDERFIASVARRCAATSLHPDECCGSRRRGRPMTGLGVWRSTRSAGPALLFV